jgi:hypothetical protein
MSRQSANLQGNQNTIGEEGEKNTKDTIDRTTK